MSCCGRGATTPGGIISDSASRRRSRTGNQHRGIYIQYVGVSVLTAYGPVSGRSYRFNTPGAVLAVDPRDRASLEAIAKLRRVESLDSSR